MKRSFRKFVGFILFMAMLLPMFTSAPVSVMADDSDFVIANGVVTAYSGKGGDIVIPDGVKELDIEVLGWGVDINSLTLPEGLTTLSLNGQYSADDIKLPSTLKKLSVISCYNIKQLELPDSLEELSLYYSFVTSLNLPKNLKTLSIVYCSEMESVSVPASVANLTLLGGTLADISKDNQYYLSDDGCVYNKKGTELLSCPTSKESLDILDTTTSIAYNALSECYYLRTLSIPASVVKIDDTTLKQAYGITKITVAKGNKNYATYDDALYTKDLTKLLYFPADKSNVSFPKECKGYAPGIFNFTSIKEITLPNGLKELASGEFTFCSSLEKVVLPKSLKVIGDYAFEGCSSLKEINIPGSVTKIGAGSFYFCNSLTEMNIPASVTSIGDNAFLYCRGLEKITVAAKNKKYTSYNDALYTKNMKTLLYCPDSQMNVVIREGTKNIAYGAITNGFYDNSRSIRLPKSLKSMDFVPYLTDYFVYENSYGAKQLENVELDYTVINDKELIKNITAANLSVKKGGSKPISVTTTALAVVAKPKLAGEVSLSYSSSDKAIASVTSSGIVKGKKAGKVTISITAKLADGTKYTTKATVKVK